MRLTDKAISFDCISRCQKLRLKGDSHIFLNYAFFEIVQVPVNAEVNFFKFGFEKRAVQTDAILLLFR